MAPFLLGHSKREGQRVAAYAAVSRSSGLCSLEINDDSHDLFFAQRRVAWRSLAKATLADGERVIDARREP
jgi:hypothetical protein